MYSNFHREHASTCIRKDDSSQFALEPLAKSVCVRRHESKVGSLQTDAGGSHWQSEPEAASRDCKLDRTHYTQNQAVEVDPYD